MTESQFVYDQFIVRNQTDLKMGISMHLLAFVFAVQHLFALENLLEGVFLKNISRA
jgi:hypothetical protein